MAAIHSLGVLVLDRLARAVIHRSRLVLIAAAVFLAVAGAVGGGVVSHLSSSGFDDPASDSYRAESVLRERFGAGPGNIVLLVRAPGGVDTAGTAGQMLTRRFAAEPGVADVTSYWASGRAPSLKSRDGTEALVIGRLTGTDDEALVRAGELRAAYDGSRDGLTVEVGGTYPVFHEIGERIKSDLARSEAIVFPLTFLLLVLVFGGAVAAGLPLGIGVLAVLGTFLVLRVLTLFTDVSVYALNMTTSLGLGLAIDYSLFIISRYREELHGGRAPYDAVRVSIATAGRTVLFSAATVGLSLAALLVFPLYFLRSFAYAGIAVVALAAFGAVVVLPALLAVLGHRVDALRLRRSTPKPVGQGGWHRVAMTVMRRPGLLGGAALAILLTLGAPFLGVRFGLPDDRVQPRDASTSRVAQSIRTDFGGRESDALVVVAATSRPDAVAAYASTVSRFPSVDRVESTAGTFVRGASVAPGSPRYAGRGGGTWLSVVPTVEPYSDAGVQLVTQLRAAPAPFPVLVGGASARFVDTEHSVGSRLPLALALIAVATALILFLFTGSVLVPVKAIALNLLSLSATFGAMVYVFQQGHLRWLVGDFPVTGYLDTTIPILMFCVAFGLSMDYEVFLLSRIKEEYDVTRDNTSAVALGLERTGRLVSAAALLIAVVFLSFATSGITFIKLFGLGMAIAVVVDATLVRGILVPAFMRLAGNANWWAPGPLRRLHTRIGLREGDGPSMPKPRSVEPDRVDVR